MANRSAFIITVYTVMSMWCIGLIYYFISLPKRHICKCHQKPQIPADVFRTRSLGTPPPDNVKKVRGIGKRYSIIAGSIPDFANNTVYIDDHGVPQSTPRAWGYAYNLPLTTLAWKRMNFETLVLLTVNTKKIDNNARVLWKYIDQTLRHFGAIPIYFDVPSHMKARLGQVLRLVAGDLGLSDNDFVVTGDADYWPLMRTRLDIEEDKDVLLLNAFCCGKFKRSCSQCMPGYLYREYSMLNIGMRVKEWRAIMGEHLKVTSENHQDNNYTLADIAPMIRKIKDFEGDGYKYIFNVKHGNRGWSLDQQWASINIEKYFHIHGKVKGQFEAGIPKGCRRITTRGWKAATEKEGCMVDAHVYKSDVWRKNVWRLMKPFMEKLFDEKAMADIEKYREAFLSAMDKRKFDTKLEFR